jgi:hypothetical protein
MEAGFFSRPSSESPARAGELKIERAFPMAASSAMLFEMFFFGRARLERGGRNARTVTNLQELARPGRRTT